MKKLSQRKFLEIRAWIYRTARPIDLALWEFYFENATNEKFLKAWSFYQNEDGGFAYGLEPDCWSPHSSPYMTNWWSASDLEDILTDSKHPIILGILKYLNSGAYLTNGEWPWSVPSNNNYPHAPWLECKSESNRAQNIGVTGRLTAFILIYADENSEIFKKGVSLTESLIEKFNSFADIIKENSQEMHADNGFYRTGYRELIYAIERRGLEKQFNYAFIKEMLAEETDANTASLDALVEEMENTNFLNIQFDNYFTDDKHFGYCAITQLWWNVYYTIDNLKNLKKADRIESNSLT